MSEPRNVAASVHARLLRGARERGEDFNLTLKRYVAERFLFRLGESPRKEQFVLKGAMLFALWGGSFYRATRDLDFTGYLENDQDTITGAVREICVVPCPDDGLTFMPSTVRAEPIRDNSEYRGLRVTLRAMLGRARLDLQIDVGFANAIHPPARWAEYPVLIGGPAPRVRAYPREATIAEKVHAMVIHGMANSRMKDFYDVFVLARHFSFSGPTLSRAIATTFAQRGTSASEAQPAAFTAAFYADPQRAAEWTRYLMRDSLPGAPDDFGAVGEVIGGFLGPVYNTLASGASFEQAWPPGGPWEATS